MTDTREATPRPWAQGLVTDRNGDPATDEAWICIDDLGDNEIIIRGDAAPANAALIVRAVNSDDLWPEAIRIIKALYAAVLIDDDEGLAEHAEPMEAARALLSKLEASHGSA